MTHQNAALPPKLLGTALILLFIGGRAGAGQGAQPLPESESRAVLQQMAQTLAAHATLKARFVQERRLALFDDVLRMKGYFYFQKPGRIRWEFVDPYASIMILLEDGRTERFDLAGGKAVRVRTDGSQVSGEILGQISRWMSGDIAPALRDFHVQLFRPAAYRLSLRPRSESLAALLSRIEFEIDPKSFLVLSISLWESEGDVTVIRFVEQSADALLPERLFDVVSPRLLDEKER